MGVGQDGACTHSACSRPSYPTWAFPTNASPLWGSLTSGILPVPQHPPSTLSTTPSMVLAFAVLAWAMPCSPRRLLLGELDAWHTTHPPDHHAEAVVTSEDLDGAAHGDVLQANAVHLCDLVTNTEPGLLCEGHTARLGT